MRRMRHLKPREIQGCQLALDASIPTSLYDATSGGSLVAADGAVARWEDQSGNARHATQGTGSLRPLRKVAISNGGDAISFDGVDDYLDHGATAGSDTATLFVAGVRRATQTDFRVLLTYGSSAPGSFINLRGATGAVGTYTTVEVSSTCTPANNTPITLSQTESSGLSWMQNGASAGSAAGNAANQPVASVAAGKDSGVYMYHSQFDYFCAAIYSAALSTYCLRRLHHAAMRKWRIAA